MTDNEDNLCEKRTKPTLHGDEDEAVCYEAEAENIGLEATWASKT